MDRSGEDGPIYGCGFYSLTGDYAAEPDDITYENTCDASSLDDNQVAFGLYSIPRTTAYEESSERSPYQISREPSCIFQDSST